MFPHIWLTTPVSDEYKASKKRRGLCAVYRCRRPRADRRVVCNTCKCRLFRLKRPDYYAWVCLEASARKRGIGFEITFEQFQEFCVRTDYLQTKGKHPDSSSINRKKHWLPYTIDNIEIMSIHDNTSRRFDPPAPTEGDPY